MSEIKLDGTNVLFESLWRKLTRAQRLFVVEFPSYKTKKDCAEALDLNPKSVYNWPGSVWKAVELYEDSAVEGASSVLKESVTKAALIKAAGLDSADERIQQMTATEILDRYFGKPKQRTEHTGEDGGPVAIEMVALGGIDPDKDI